MTHCIQKTIVLLLLVFVPLSTPARASEGGEKWGYAGEEGPENWGEISDEFDICSRGQNQSPIDLTVDAHTDLPEIRFEYTKPGRLEEIDTGHTIMEKVNPGNYIWLLDHRYELKQFHFHSPSEHHVDGKSYAMEVHLVHQDADGDFAVIALFFEEGAHNGLMDDLPSFRAARGEDPIMETPLDYNELFPNRREYFYYNGSLTTPPVSTFPCYGDPTAAP